jgi:predicted alpha/beta-fold hydrolase
LTNIFNTRFPNKKIFLSGFSLGGNVILKFLGELGEEARNKNILGAAVTCVPFDPVASQGFFFFFFDYLSVFLLLLLLFIN